MRVIKRNGQSEEISFDKVLKRIRVLCNGLGAVDPDVLAQKVCSKIYNGVSTSELDELAAQICSSMICEHPDFGALASRIIISNMQKNTTPSFSEAVTKLYFNGFGTDTRVTEHNPVVSKALYDVVIENQAKLNSYIDYSRDFNLDYFGFKTLEYSYLLKVGDKVIERPQHMFMRVALGIHGEDIKDALETYDFMSRKFFVHATPTLFNAGTPLPQCSSCFLLGTEDSVSGIYDSVKNCALISKLSGGIGLHVSNIRSKGSRIRGTNGISSGIIPMLKVYNDTARYINQGGKRNGSFCIYLEPWHADVESFIELRKNHGNESERTRDLFLALWVPDLFMRRIRDGGDWSLMCPDQCPGLNEVYGPEFDALYERYESEGKFRKRIPAQKLWNDILRAQIETGNPFILYKDAANAKSNQKNLGTIKSSNLCVAPETMLLTSKGYFPIKKLKDQTVEVWNGKRFSEVTVCQTGIKQPLITVTISNGSVIRCTPQHKFFVKNTADVVEAQNLKSNDKLRSFKISAILTMSTAAVQITDGYTQGVYAATATGGKHNLVLEKNNVELLKSICWSSADRNDDGSVIVTLENNTMSKREFKIASSDYVPINHNIDTRLAWLEGYIDAAGSFDVIDNLICLPNKPFNKHIVYLLHTLGICVPFNDGIRLNENHVGHLLRRSTANGFHTRFDAQLKFENVTWTSINSVGTCSNVHVVSVEDKGEVDDTFCFTEPLEHAGVFNGILTGQCTEIIQHTDKENHAVCNLASIGLPSFIKNGAFDFDTLHKVAGILVKNLNKVIDINFYPTRETRFSNMKNRPLGIGVQGLADTFAILKMPFDSQEAAALNRDIFETIYHGALTSSIALAKKRKDWIAILKAMRPDEKEAMDLLDHLRLTPEEMELPAEFAGAYASFVGSPASQGQLQFDLWSASGSADDFKTSERWDWASLKVELKQHGLRNSLLLAPMPTASTSQILAFNECIEPFTSNLYQRRTLAGEFIIINKYLVAELLALNLWTPEIQEKIVVADGSIQGIAEIPVGIKALFKTVWEIKQKVMIDLAADRGHYVCQSQSLNLFLEEPDSQKLTAMHFYGWQKGLKTGMYYLRTKAKAKAQQFTVEPTQIKACKRDDPDCLSCGS